MAGPHEDVPPSELFLKLQERRPSEVVNFPRRTPDGKPMGRVRIQVLGMVEHDRARVAAKTLARDKLKLSKDDQDSPLGSALVGDAVARELLAIACLEEKNFGSDDEPFYPRVFPSGDAIAAALSADEVAVLFNCYLLVQAKYGPFERTIETEQDLSSWVKRLVEGAAEFPLQHLSSAHWAEAASLLAARAYLLSGILESLFESLPSSLQSRLGTYSLGTGFFGSPAKSSSADGSVTSLKVGDVDITIEDAKLMASRMKDVEAGALAVLDNADRER